jgi:hypothetical protein
VIAEVSGTASLSTTAVTGSNVGSYPITPTLGTLAATNYTFSFTNGTLTVTQASQAISFTGPGTGTVGTPATLSATGGASGNPVVFTVGASSASVCNVSGTNGTTLNYTAAGTCVIDANQLGNTNYLAAPQVQQSVPVSLPLLSFTHSNFDCSSGSIVTSGTWAANVSRTGSTTTGVTVTVANASSGGSLTISAGASESSAQFTVNRPGSNSGLVVTASSPGYTSISCTVFKQ